MSIEDEVQALRTENKQIQQQVDDMGRQLAEIKQQLYEVLDNLAGSKRPKQSTKLREFKEGVQKALRNAIYTDYANDRLRQKNRTLKDLAKEIHVHYNELVSRLNGTSRVALKCSEAQDVIRTLIKWEGITHKDEANRLLDLIDCSRLSSEDLRILELEGKPLLPSVREKLIEDLNQNDASHVIGKPEYSQDDLEKFLLDQSMQGALRAPLLKAYIANGYKNPKLYTKLSNDNDFQVRKMLLDLILEGSLELSREDSTRFLVEGLNDSDRTIQALAMRVAVELMDRDKLPLDLLGTVSRHPYWAVRITALRYLVTLEPQKSFDLLYKFRNTSYHASQRLIREYIEEHVSNNNFDEEQYRKSLEILEQLSKAPRVTKPSKEKDQQLLEQLRSRRNIS